MFIRRSQDRGHADHGWLESYHTFSFAQYYDEAQMGFGALRVINEDWIDGDHGFGPHPHENWEIITYVISGLIEHRDSLGNISRIGKDEVQYISAGTGITHSEMNPSSDTLHLFQIWIAPNVEDAKPKYAERKLGSMPTNTLQLLVSRDGREGSIQMRQDADLWRGFFATDGKFDFTADKARKYWLHIVEGEAKVNGELLKTGDAAGIEGEKAINLKAKADTHILLFNLP